MRIDKNAVCGNCPFWTSDVNYEDLKRDSLGKCKTDSFSFPRETVGIDWCKTHPNCLMDTTEEEEGLRAIFTRAGLQ